MRFLALLVPMLAIAGCAGNPIKNEIAPVDETSEQQKYCEIFNDVAPDFQAFVEKLLNEEKFSENEWLGVEIRLDRLSASDAPDLWIGSHYDYLDMQDQINQLRETGSHNFDTERYLSGYRDLSIVCG